MHIDSSNRVNVHQLNGAFVSTFLTFNNNKLHITFTKLWLERNALLITIKCKQNNLGTLPH